MGKLEGESWKYCLEIASVLEISRAEEARTELSICEADLGKCLGDGRLSGPGKAIQPEHTVVSFVLHPTFELQEDIHPSPPKASLIVPGIMPGFIGVTHIFHKTTIHVFLFLSY